LLLTSETLTPNPLAAAFDGTAKAAYTTGPERGTEKLGSILKNGNYTISGMLARGTGDFL